MNSVEKNEMSAKTPKTKLPYHAPTLSEYGDIREITLGGRGTMADNPGHEMDMT